MIMKNEIIVKIENIDGMLVVDSRDIAIGLNKRHSDVMDKIKEVLNERESSLVEYKDAKGEIRPCFQVTKDGFILLCMNYTGYNDFKRAYIKKFNEMASELANSHKLPATYKEALLALVAAEEEKEKLELELKEKNTMLEKAEFRLELSEETVDNLVEKVLYERRKNREFQEIFK